MPEVKLIAYCQCCGDPIPPGLIDSRATFATGQPTLSFAFMRRMFLGETTDEERSWISRHITLKSGTPAEGIERKLLEMTRGDHDL